MKKLFFLTLVFVATFAFANSASLRSATFSAENAGTYRMHSIEFNYEGISGISTISSDGITWCSVVGGQDAGCVAIPENDFNIYLSDDAILTADAADFNDNPYSVYSNQDDYTFSFSSDRFTMSFTDEDGTFLITYLRVGAAPATEPSTTNEAQTDYTKELQTQEYGSTEQKAKVQEIKKELLATTAASVDEVADGNGLVVTYKEGHSGLIYHAPKDSKGGSGSMFLPIDLEEKLKIFKRAATRSGSNKVLAIAAQYWDWGYNDDVPQLASMLSGAGYDVTYKHYDSREAGKMSDFENWSEYAIVLISTHGIARDTRSRTTNSINMAIDLNIAPDDSSVTAEDLSKKRLLEWDNCADDGTCHKSLLATNLFFEEHLSSLPNTLVYVSACHVGKNDAMAEVLFNKGAQTMIAYNDLVQVSFAKTQGVDIFTRLVGDESLESIFSLPGNSDISTGYHTGIKENDSTPAEIVVYQREAVNYEAFLSGKTYNIAGSFSGHDFAGVDKAFDWVFSTTSGLNFQLQGKAPSPTDAFGWKQVNNINNLSPAWYMFPLGSDVDGDNSEAFDWIFISASSNSGSKSYKLAGVEANGTFKYSTPINLNYTINGNRVTFSK